MSSYYKIIKGIRFDRELLETAERAVAGAGDGRISRADAELLLKEIKDGGRITKTEQRTLAYIRRNFKWTEAADKWFREEMGENIPKAIEVIVDQIVREEFELLYMDVDMPGEEVRRQEQLFKGTVGFNEALHLALHRFINDASGVETPRQFVLEIHQEEWDQLAGHEKEEAITDRVKTYMDEGQFVLIRYGETMYDYDDTTYAELFPEYAFPTPENEEPLAKKWAFGLYLPTLSDHLYWAIVDRDGQGEDYIYGFN